VVLGRASVLDQVKVFVEAYLRHFVDRNIANGYHTQRITNTENERMKEKKSHFESRCGLRP